jgi:hypothetical protein
MNDEVDKDDQKTDVRNGGKCTLLLIGFWEVRESWE